MHLAPLSLSALVAAVFNLGCLIPQSASAVTLNFSATLTNGTCSLNLDKSTLRLPDVSHSGLRPQQLYSAQPFTLSVTECSGGGTPTLAPVVVMTGPGVSQDNKWLFRQTTSAAGSGIMVFNSDIEPQYSMTELRNGGVLPLAGVGQNPVEQVFNFYAALGCISSTSCSDAAPGTVTASLMFVFAYQ